MEGKREESKEQRVREGREGRRKDRKKGQGKGEEGRGRKERGREVPSRTYIFPFFLLHRQLPSSPDRLLLPQWAVLSLLCSFISPTSLCCVFALFDCMISLSSLDDLGGCTTHPSSCHRQEKLCAFHKFRLIPHGKMSKYYIHFSTFAYF